MLVYMIYKCFRCGYIGKQKNHFKKVNYNNYKYLSKKIFNIYTLSSIIEYNIIKNFKKKLIIKENNILKNKFRKYNLNIVYFKDLLNENNNLEKNHPILKAVNYKQAFMVLNGSLKESEMLEKSIFGTRQLAKRQITWMRSWQDLSFFDLHEQDAANEFIKKGLKL